MQGKTRAEKMFNKRLKDLSPDELKQYNAVSKKESRKSDKIKQYEKEYMRNYYIEVLKERRANARKLSNSKTKRNSFGPV